MSLLNKLSQDFVFSKNGSDLARRFRLCNLRWRLPISVEWDNAAKLYRCRDSQTAVYVSRKERISRYFGGVEPVLSELAKQYMLAKCSLSDADVMIDCGANVGEVSKYVQSTYGASVLSLEPDPDEFRALCANVPRGRNFNLALWNEDRDRPFFRKNASGDSSLIEMPEWETSNVVPAIRLDTLLANHGIRTVNLLKLEAEGAEPEILVGAGDRLRDIEYISADVGPERGISQESTIVSATNYLLARGFELVTVTTSRLICLFRNKAFAPRHPS